MADSQPLAVAAPGGLTLPFRVPGTILHAPAPRPYPEGLAVCDLFDSGIEDPATVTPRRWVRPPHSPLPVTCGPCLEWLHA